MADSAEELQMEETTGDSAEDVAAAAEIGWTPKEKFRGDPEKWVTAKTFLERGQVVLPILRKQNQELHAQLNDLRARDTARDTELRVVKSALKAIEESQDADLLERVAATKSDLEDQIAAASEAGDHRRVAKLTTDMVELIAAEKAKPAKAAEAAPVDSSIPVTAEHRAWESENADWFGKDEDKTATSLALARVIAAKGLTGKAFYQELDRRLEKQFGNGAEPRGTSKVADGKPSGASGEGGEQPKGYSDLPREARETCDRLAKKMVGEGKPHKDVKSWRASYAKQFADLGA